MTKNNQLSEQLNYVGESHTPTHLHLCSYNATRVQRHDGKRMEELLPHLQDDAINWVQIHGFRDTEIIRNICQHFGIDILTTQDILNSCHPTKIEKHEAYNVVILKQLSLSGKEYQPQQMVIIQGNRFVLTFMERENDFLNDIHTAIEKNVFRIRTRQSDFLLSVILNSVMTSFMSLISDYEDKLEDLEEALLSPNGQEMPGIEEIQRFRRNFRIIRKSILPFKEEMGKLLHADNILLNKVHRPFFNDVNDHLQFVLQTLDGCREMISAVVDLYLSNNNQRMNNIMKQLAVVSTIFIPLTFLAGIWGMNFEWMPELHWRYGYLFAWLLMLALVAAVFLYFRRKKWY